MIYSRSLLVMYLIYIVYMCVDPKDRMWSTGEGNGKPFLYSCPENSMNSMKRQKDRTLKDELTCTVNLHHLLIPYF